MRVSPSGQVPRAPAAARVTCGFGRDRQANHRESGVKPNYIRNIWQNKGFVVNGWCSIPSSFCAEVMAHMGWDSLCVDLQHGVIDYQTAVTMLQGICTTDVTPIARVPWNDPALIMKMLDAGAYGIICPMINTRAECERFVGACRYAPVGYRSSGPIRAALWAGDDYHAKANDVVLTFAMIETAEAVKNLDEILTTPGLDAVYIGPSDLSLTLGGKPGLDHTEGKVVGAIDTILAGCKRHGVRAGLHTGSPAFAKQMIAKGFDFVTLLNDSRILTMAGRKIVEETKSITAQAKAGGVY
jgi:4-hydroxy-2-oxoheptanedioate aldolase